MFYSEEKANRYLIAIGSPTSPEMNLEALDRVESDVERVVSLFCKEPQGYKRVLTDRISLGAPSKVIKNELMNWFYCSERKPYDCVIIYYAGHGSGEGADTQHYLFTSDSIRNRHFQTAIKTSFLAEFILEAGPDSPKNVLLILDTCEAGQGVNEAMSLAMKSRTALKLQESDANLWCISSSGLHSQAGDGDFVEALEYAMQYDKSWMHPEKEFLNPMDLIEIINNWFERNEKGQRAAVIPFLSRGKTYFIVNPYYRIKDYPSLMPLLPERLPNDLQNPPIFIGRENQLDTLKKTIAPDKKIWLYGQKGIGKKTLLSRVLNVEKNFILKNFGKIPILLRLKLDSKEPNVLTQALVNALGRNSFPGCIFDDDYFEGDRQVSHSITVKNDGSASNIGCLFSYLEETFSTDIPFLIIEDEHGVLNEIPSVRSSLARLLKHQVFCQSCVIFVLPEELCLTKEDFQLNPEHKIKLEPLSNTDNQLLFSEYLDVTNKKTITHKIIDFLPKGLPLTPYLIKVGCKNFNHSVQHDYEESSPETLIKAIIDVYLGEVPVVKKIIEEISLGDDNFSFKARVLGGFETLHILAILSEQPFTLDHLSDAGLSLSKLGKLIKLELIIIEGEEYYLSELIIQEIRQVRLKSLLEKSSPEILSSFSSRLQKLIEALASSEKPQDIRKIRTSCLEAIKWLGQFEQDAISQILEPLVSFVITESVDDYFFPLTDKQIEDYQNNITKTPHLDPVNSSIASVICLARFNSDRQKFVERLEDTVRLLAGSHKLNATGRQLLALDRGIFIGTSRFKCGDEVFKIRQDLRAPLKETLRVIQDPGVIKDPRPRQRFLKAATAWLLNSAWVAANIDKLKEARSLLTDARSFSDILNRSVPPGEIANRLWMESWIRQIEARLEINTEMRLFKLQEARNCSLKVFQLEKPIRWLQSYLRAVRRILTELSDDDEKEKEIKSLFKEIEKKYGPNDREWPIDVCALVATLLRDTSLHFSNPKTKLSVSKNSVALLQFREKDIRQSARDGDLRQSLVLIRNLSNLAHQFQDLDMQTEAKRAADKAYEYSKKLCKSRPTASLWQLVLTVAEQSDSLVNSNKSNYLATANIWEEYYDFGQRNPRGSRLEKELNEFQCWRKHQKKAGSYKGEGRLELWLEIRKWSRQGSLEYYVSRHSQHGKVWRFLERKINKRLRKGYYDFKLANEQIKILTQIHDARIRTLKKIEEKFGPSIPLYLQHARLLAQYERSVAIRNGGRYSDTSVVEVFECAERLWPNSYQILEERARYYRYVWDLEQAIMQFEKLYRSSSSGDQRRRAALSLVECFLLASSASRILIINGKSLGPKALALEAKKHLDALASYDNILDETSLYQERVALECRLNIDWPSIEDEFDNFIPGIGEYISSVIEFYSPESGVANSRDGSMTKAFQDLSKIPQNRTSMQQRYEFSQNSQPQGSIGDKLRKKTICQVFVDKFS